jgi:putative transposase
MADHTRSEPVVDALQLEADGDLEPPPHHPAPSTTAIIGTYTTWAFGHRLRVAGMLGFVGSIGDCFDNSVVERDLRARPELLQPGPADTLPSATSPPLSA